VEAQLQELVPDVRVVVCKGYVGYHRQRQFAVLRAKGAHLQLGLALDDTVDPGPAVPVSGLGGGRITHAMVLSQGLEGEARRLVLAAKEVSS
jgi:hypothetical protein